MMAWTFRRTTSRLEDGSGFPPIKVIQAPSSISASCIHEAWTFRGTTRRQRDGFGFPPSNATLMASLISDTITIMEKAWTKIWFKPTCGSTWPRRHLLQKTTLRERRRNGFGRKLRVASLVMNSTVRSTWQGNCTKADANEEHVTIPLAKNTFCLTKNHEARPPRNEKFVGNLGSEPDIRKQHRQELSAGFQRCQRNKECRPTECPKRPEPGRRETI